MPEPVSGSGGSHQRRLIVPLIIDDPVAWLYTFDDRPLLVPEWPEGSVMGLVLVSHEDDEIEALVILTESIMRDMAELSMDKPKLWFRIPRTALCRVCDGLSPEDFERGEE